MGERFFRWRLVVIVGFFGLAVAWAVWMLKNPDLAVRAPLVRSLSELVGLRLVFVVSGALALLAFALRASGEARLGAAVYGQTASTRVVTGGPFRWLRHPLYAGTWLFFVAATAPYLAPLVLAVLSAAFFACLRAIAIHEEVALQAAHGDAWTRYAAAVPRLFGVAGAVEPDGIRLSGSNIAAATLGNLGLLSIGLYRVLVGFGAPTKLLGVLNVACLGLWLAVVFVRRARRT